MLSRQEGRQPLRRITIACLTVVLCGCITQQNTSPTSFTTPSSADLSSVAAAALSHCATKRSYDVIVKKFTSSSDYAKQYLALALGRIGKREAIPLLREALLNEKYFRREVRQPHPSLRRYMESEGYKGTVTIYPHLAYTTALKRLGDTEWIDFLISRYRDAYPSESDGVRLSKFLARYGTLAEVRVRYSQHFTIKKLGTVLLDKKASLEDRIDAATAIENLGNREATCYCVQLLKQYAADANQKKSLNHLSKPMQTLLKRTFDATWQNPTQEAVPILQKYIHVLGWRWNIEQSLPEMLAPIALQDAVKCIPPSGSYGAAYDMLDHVRPYHADFLFKWFQRDNLTTEQKDAVLMLLAKVGDRRAIPFIRDRIGKKGASWAIERAAAFLPDRELVEPLLKAYDRSDPTLPVLVALKDKRAVRIILDMLKTGHGLGGIYDPPRKCYWSWYEFFRDYYKEKPRQIRSYRYVSVRYLKQLGAKEAVPELEKIVRKRLAELSNHWHNSSRPAEALISIAALKASKALKLAVEAYPVMPYAAINALLEINTPQAWKELKRLCSSRDWELAVLLHHRGYETGIERIIKAAKSSADREDRLALRDLRDVLNTIHHEKARKALIVILREAGNDERLWNYCPSYSKVPEIVPLLIKRFNKLSDTDKKFDVIQVIGKQGGAEAEKFLCKVISSK